MVDNVMIWKACRVLANESRLKILKRLMQGAELCVTDIADIEGVALVTASEHLRLLHESGFLRQERKSKWIFYSAELSSGNPVAENMFNPLRKQLITAGNQIPLLLSLLTSFTHPRRVGIVKNIFGFSRSFDDLIEVCDISKPAMHRHLDKLVVRKVICQDADVYRIVPGGTELKRVLIKLCRELK
jgi:ArsR family transcriptional regulator